MIVFPTVIPALDIIEVGGQPIAEGTNNAAVIELAVGAPTNQTVKVQARNFTNDVPIRVVVTPESGPRGEFDAVILQASGRQLVGVGEQIAFQAGTGRKRLPDPCLDTVGPTS